MVLEKFANKSFVTRTLSGIVLVTVMLATIVPGGNILFVANMLISLVGVYELYKVLGLEKKNTGSNRIRCSCSILCFDIFWKE